MAYFYDEDENEVICADKPENDKMVEVDPENHTMLVHIVTEALHLNAEEQDNCDKRTNDMLMLTITALAN